MRSFLCTFPTLLLPCLVLCFCQRTPAPAPTSPVPTTVERICTVRTALVEWRSINGESGPSIPTDASTFQFDEQTVRQLQRQGFEFVPLETENTGDVVWVKEGRTFICTSIEKGSENESRQIVRSGLSVGNEVVIGIEEKKATESK